MRWKTSVHFAGDDTDHYLNQLSADRWMIKTITALHVGDHTEVFIVACQSPEYEKKAKKVK